MADILTANYGKDTGSGKKLKTGSLRRNYSSKKRAKNKSFRISNNKYKEGV